MKPICFLALFLYIQITCVCADVRAKRAYIDDSVQKYLTTFGYLPQSDFETANLRSEDQLKEAIKTLQAFGNVPITGEIDSTTKELLKKPRCGIPDGLSSFGFGNSRQKRFTVQGQKWQYTNLTWSLRPTFPQKLDVSSVRRELSDALAVWSKHSRLTFQEINSDRADILVSFHKGYHDDGYPFDGRGQVLAHAFFPGTGRGGDAHFDEEEIWLTNRGEEQEEGTSLFAVAAHEFGHSLGLSHSSVQGALMYPWYQGSKKDFDLPEDDRHGIQQLYGAKEDRLWSRNPSYPITHPPPPQTPPTTERPWNYPPNPQPPRHHPDRRPEHHPDHHPRYPDRYPDRPRENPDRPREYPHPDYPREYPDRYPYHPKNPEKPHYPDERYKPHYPTPERPTHPTRRTRPTTTTTPTTTTAPTVHHHPQRPNRPNTCDTSYDAVSVIRGEVFIFKDKYLWRIGDHGIYAGYPAEISRLWAGLPRNMTHIDAVYERPDRKIVFFVGRQYFVFTSNRLDYGYPKPLTHLGLPKSLNKIDAAMVWGHNSKTYFYSGTMYWRYDEDVGNIELDYPRDMSMWKGVPTDIDAVFQYTDGKTYFFKGRGYWKFNDIRMSVEHERPRLSASKWMQCPKTQGEPTKSPNEEIPRRKLPFVSVSDTPVIASSSGFVHKSYLNTGVIMSVVILLRSLTRFTYI